MNFRPQTLFRLVMAFLFASGAAALVYEIAWSRYLALFLGHTSYAVVAVLVAFMGGLALGNVWFGRLADRTSRPLAWYAWLEIGIGLYALAFPAWYSVCYDLFVAAARGLAPGSAGLLALKFGFGLATVLLPAVCMGGTLPLVTRLLTRSLGDLQQKVAGLYFINSLGAVAGIWLADFVWLPVIGLQSTIWAGAAINLIVGLAALLLSGWILEGRTTHLSEAADAAGPEKNPGVQGPVTAAAATSWTRGELRLAIIGIGLSGFVAMLYQVAWTRLLALALGSSTHAFSLMLITFIAGLAIGSWLVYRRGHRANPLRAFAWIELALAASVLVSMVFYEWLPFWFAHLAQLLARRPEAYPVYELVQAGICFAVMIVPTLGMGMTLPLVSRVATADPRQTGRSVGRVFAVNTVGTVLGAAVTGLWLMPWLGLARTFAFGVAVNALIGLSILLARCWPRRRGLVIGAPLAWLAVTWLAGLHFSDRWVGAFSLGLYRDQSSAPSVAEYQFKVNALRTVYHRDGAGSSVGVHLPPAPINEPLFLKVNGKTDASSGGDMETQILSGHLPLLLRPSATNVLVVGLGSGVTVGAVALHPDVRRVDVVEISPEVVAAARQFRDVNRNALEHPRVRIHIEDAKSFLLIGRERYDTIISEPSNPWMAGVAGVFSVEFYESCRQRLAPGGLMLQWIQLYEFSDEGLDMVIGTFSRVFPHVSLWQSHSSDLFLVGSVTEPRVDLDALRSRLEIPAIKADLARVNLDNLPLLLAQEVVAFSNGRFIPAQSTRVHSDYYPILEYTAQRDFFTRQLVTRFRQLDERFSRRPGTLLGRYLREHPLTLNDLAAFGGYYLGEEQFGLAAFVTLLQRWQRDAPDSLLPYELMIRVKHVAPPGELDVRRLAPRREEIRRRAFQDPALLRHYGRALMRQYSEQKSIFSLPPAQELEEVATALIQHDPDNQRTYQAWLAIAAWDREDDDACLKWGNLALADDLPRGAAKFRLDTVLPLQLGVLLADVHLRRGENALALLRCQSLRTAGYLQSVSRSEALPFEHMERKVFEAAGNAASRTRAPAAAGMTKQP